METIHRLVRSLRGTHEHVRSGGRQVTTTRGYCNMRIQQGRHKLSFVLSIYTNKNWNTKLKKLKVNDFLFFSSSEIQFDTTFLSINNNNILHTQVVVVGPSRTLVVSNRTGNNDESNTRRASEY